MSTRWLATVWVLAILYFEIVQWHLLSCEWPNVQESDRLNPEPYRILVFSDPQLTDIKSYTFIPNPLTPAVEFISDLYMLRARRGILHSLHPRENATVVLGDLLDGGRSKSIPFKQEVRRFENIFSPCNRLLYSVGNHDIGMSTGSSKLKDEAVRRFEGTFGPVNQVVRAGNFSLVFINAPSLGGKNMNEEGDKHRKETMEFLADLGHKNKQSKAPDIISLGATADDVGGWGQRGGQYAKSMEGWHAACPVIRPHSRDHSKSIGVVGNGIDDSMEVTQLAAASSSKLTLGSGPYVSTIDSDLQWVRLPRILFTHIPLWRSDSDRCFESYLSLPERETQLRYSKGSQHQTLLRSEISSEILKRTSPMLVLSGDDHDWCVYRHEEERCVPEITVPTFSWLQGTTHVGYALMSLSYDMTPEASAEPLVAVRLCVLPNQYTALRTYTCLLAITFAAFWLQFLRLLRTVAQTSAGADSKETTSCALADDHDRIRGGGGTDLEDSPARASCATPDGKGSSGFSVGRCAGITRSAAWLGHVCGLMVAMLNSLSLKIARLGVPGLKPCAEALPAYLSLVQQPATRKLVKMELWVLFQRTSLAMAVVVGYAAAIYVPEAVSWVMVYADR